MPLPEPQEEQPCPPQRPRRRQLTGQDWGHALGQHWGTWLQRRRRIWVQALASILVVGATLLLWLLLVEVLD